MGSEILVIGSLIRFKYNKSTIKGYVIPEGDEGGSRITNACSFHFTAFVARDEILRRSYQESPISVTVHSNKQLVNSSERDPCFRRDDPSSGKCIVNNRKTPPQGYVIPEADEGGYQESLASVTVHSNKLLVN